MTTIASVAVQSVIKAPVKLAAGPVAVAGVMITPEYIAIVVGAVSITASIFFMIKTYKEIKILNIKLAKEDRRSRP